MLSLHLFYLERAAEARAPAGAATLDNVRDRRLRSERADQRRIAASMEKMRAKLIADKATERAVLKAARESVDDA